MTIITKKDVKKCSKPKLLASYAITTKQDIKLEIAKNPNTPASTLNDLALESNEEILLAVAKNKSTGKRGLYRLGVKLGDERIAIAVANNYKTTEDILDDMFEIWCDFPDVIKAIKTHPNVSESTAELCTFCEMY